MMQEKRIDQIKIIILNYKGDATLNNDPVIVKFVDYERSATCSQVKQFTIIDNNRSFSF